MKSRRLLGIAALGAASASMLMVPGAGAQEAKVTYAAAAEGQALGLSIAGNALTLGKTSTQLASTPDAKAAGFGIANPLQNGAETGAEVSGADASEGTAEETCESNPLDALTDNIPGLGLDIVCSSSQAAIAGGLPTATATGRVGTLELNPVQPLLDTPLSAVVDGLDGGVDELLAGLEPLTGPIDENTGLGLDDTLNELFDQLFDGVPLLTVTLGETATQVKADGTNVISACVAEGARIDILDAPPVLEGELEIDPPPVASIIIGESSTTVTASTTSGDATPEFVGAIATLEIPTSPALDGTTLEPGVVQEIPLPAPLNSSITLGGGTTGTTDDGQTFARASAVRLHLLQGVEGGIELALADCQSFGGASVELPAVTTTTTQPPLLPRTGSDGPNPLALAATIGFAGLGLALLRKTRSV